MNTSPTWLTYATAVIASLALVVSFSTLVFNVVSWRRSGRRAQAMALADREPDGSAILSVTIHSSGRQSVYPRLVELEWVSHGLPLDETMHKASADAFERYRFRPDDLVDGPALGSEVPAGHHASWLFRLPNETFEALPKVNRCYALVVFGDGQSARARVVGTRFWA